MWGAKLPIPDSLNHKTLKFECPKCRHPIIRKGSWFKVIATFKCPNCNEGLRLGYPEKLRLFEKHMRLSGHGEPPHMARRTSEAPAFRRSL